MKKFFAIATLVAVALTGCVKNEVITPNAGEIQFKNFTLSSKALILPAENAEVAFPTDQTFGAIAYNGATEYVGAAAAEVKWKAGFWGYSATKYWPGDDSAVTFYPYYPYGETVTCNTTSGISFPTVDLGTTLGDQKDYMIAACSGEYKFSDEKSVTVAFEHLSSMLLFSVKDLSSNTNDADYDLLGKITLKSIVVNDVNTKGAYANTAANAVAGTWTAEDTNTDFTVYNDAAGMLVPVAGATVTTPESGAVIVVPGVIVEDEMTVTITYDIAEYKYDGVIYNATIDNVATLKLETDAISSWEQGKKYVYTLKFNLSGEAHEITFTPTVKPWVAAAQDITVE